MTDLEIFDTPEAAARAAAEAIGEALVHAIAERGHANLCVTGGTSPGPVYDALQAAPLVSWVPVRITLSDERWVDPASPESNEKLVRDRLLQGPIAAATFIPLKSEADLDHGAWTADLKVSEIVPFDAVLLGMGEDGHFASLFPGHPVLEEGLSDASSRLVLPVEAMDPAPAQPRATLTLHALASAGLILVLMRGEAKKAVLEGPPDKPIHALLNSTRVKMRLLWSS